MPASPAQSPAPTPTRTPATPAAEVLHARRTLLALYFLTGIAVATWLSRLPSITALLDLSSGARPRAPRGRRTASAGTAGGARGARSTKKRATPKPAKPTKPKPKQS